MWASVFSPPFAFTTLSLNRRPSSSDTVSHRRYIACQFKTFNLLSRGHYFSSLRTAWWILAPVSEFASTRVVSKWWHYVVPNLRVLEYLFTCKLTATPAPPFPSPHVQYANAFGARKKWVSNATWLTALAPKDNLSNLQPVGTAWMAYKLSFVRSSYNSFRREITFRTLRRSRPSPHVGFWDRKRVRLGCNLFSKTTVLQMPACSPSGWNYQFMVKPCLFTSYT